MMFAAGFIVCAVIIFFAGKKLAFYGDIIAEHTGLGKAWIGLILLSTVTSLPELMVGVSSAAIVKSADLAVGDILGSCAFNLCILAMMDMFMPKYKTLSGAASPKHVLTASLGIILVAVAGIGLFLPDDIVISTWLGLTSLSFIIIYLVSIRMIYVFESRDISEALANPVHDKQVSLKTAFVKYGMFAVITICAALALPYFAEHIAEATGLGATFTGTLFLAASTSLPEIAVSIAAVRMGAVDMAVANLLGSNLFNILILALDDVFYTSGHLLKDAAESHIISVFAVIVMTAIAVVGLTFHSQTKRFLMAWDAVLILAVYIVNLVLLYKFV